MAIWQNPQESRGLPLGREGLAGLLVSDKEAARLVTGTSRGLGSARDVDAWRGEVVGLVRVCGHW